MSPIFGFKKFVGVDIGTTAVKVVELRNARKNPALENYGESQVYSTEERPFRMLERDTFSLSNQQTAKAIKEILTEAKIKTKDANFSVPDFSSFFTTFKLPIMSREEVVEAIRYEVRPYVPLPISEVNLEWVVTDGEFSKTPLKILAVAIPSEIISQYQEISELAGLELKILEPEVLSFARSCIKKADRQKAVGLIDIGARSTTCSVFDKGILKTSHSFNVGGNELTQVLSKSLAITQVEAEMVRNRRGILEGQQSAQVREIFMPLVDSILKEIKDVLRAFYLAEGKEMEKIILSGGEALLPGLKDYFQKDLAKPCEIADPFSEITSPEILKDVLKNIGPGYAIAVGLALKGFE